MNRQDRPTFTSTSRRDFLKTSGAAISGATVEIANADTGFKQSTKTGETGLYRFTVLPLGTYEVAVQAAGFGVP